jgi:ABC-type multidrug transport system permease subunit
MDYYFDVLQETSTDPLSPTSKLKHAEPLFFAEQWTSQGLTVKGDNVATGSARDVEAAAKAAADAATRTSVLQQFIVLLDRCCYDYIRDKTKLMGGIGLKFGVGAVFGVIWLNQGRGNHTQGKIYTVEGPIFFCCFSAVFDTMFALIIKYPLTRALIQREYRNRYYSIGPYYFAELLSRSIFECFNAIFLGVPCFFLVGLALSASQFFIFMSVLSMLSVIGAAIGIVVGTQCKDIQEAQGMIMPVLMPLMLFSGFFIPYDEIPVFFKWLYDLSFLRYGFNILKVNQWKNINFDDCDYTDFVNVTSACPVTCYVDGEDYLKQTDASTLSMGTNFLVVFAFMVAITCYSFVSMRYAVMKKARTG